MKILEIGCAGGLLLHKIKQINPSVNVTGLDRDFNHIDYAKNKSSELCLDCNFIIGDALKLPFEDNSFDLVFSHTVIEHIETQPFLCEQFRVLKPNGIIKVLSVRTGLNVSPENWKPISEQEKMLFDKSWEGSSEFDNQNNIGKYELKESSYPIEFTKTGFIELDIQFMSLMNYAPDNSSVADELALKQIEANRLSTFESVKKALRRNPQALSKEEQDTLSELIDKRYDERVKKYKNGEKVWDIATSTVMVISGMKPSN